jgi:hypothetical protein
VCTTIQLPNAKQITYEARRIRQGWTPRVETKRQRVGERHQRELYALLFGADDCHLAKAS